MKFTYVFKSWANKVGTGFTVVRNIYVNVVYLGVEAFVDS